MPTFFERVRDRMPPRPPPSRAGPSAAPGRLHRVPVHTRRGFALTRAQKKAIASLAPPRLQLRRAEVVLAAVLSGTLGGTPPSSWRKRSTVSHALPNLAAVVTRAATCTRCSEYQVGLGVAAVAAAARPEKDLQRRRDAERGHLAVEPAQVALHAVHDAEQVARAQPHLPGEDRLALGVLAQRLRRALDRGVAEQRRRRPCRMIGCTSPPSPR